LFIVTFKDLYLGTGWDFFDSFAGERLEAALGCRHDESPVPLKHIYIISAEEFGYFIACVVNGKCSFANTLRDAVAKDSQPDTKCLPNLFNTCQMTLMLRIFRMFGQRSTCWRSA